MKIFHLTIMGRVIYRLNSWKSGNSSWLSFLWFSLKNFEISKDKTISVASYRIAPVCGGREISEMKRFLNFWVLHSPNSIFHGCAYSFVLNFDWLIEVEFEPPGTDSRAEVILEQSFWSKERRSWLWIQMRIWRSLRNRQNPGIKNHQAQHRNNICTKNIKRRP